MKKIIKLTESDLHNIIKESVNKILENDTYDYDSNYEELIKNEYHNLCELETKVPYLMRPQIHSMAAEMQGILFDIKTKNDISKI